jgi:two-component system response regulator ResD
MPVPSKARAPGADARGGPEPYCEDVTRILVVDDDPTVAEVVVGYLERADFEAIRVGDGLEALQHVAHESVDLVVLDRMLPGMDGLDVCRVLRAQHPGMPIVMLTARGEEEDRIAGLQVGADDYVTKPFSPRELVLRVQSVLRRSAPPESVDGDGPVLRDGDLEVDAGARRVIRAGREVPLTVREFDLLAFLLSRPGHAFSREQLMNSVWGWNFGDQSTVTVHVRRLREKIEEDPTNPVRLATVWGVGYRWDPSDQEGNR